MSKRKQSKLLYKTIKCTVPATKFKVMQLQALRQALQDTLVQTAHLTDQMIVKHDWQQLPTYLPADLTNDQSQ